MTKLLIRKMAVRILVGELKYSCSEDFLLEMNSKVESLIEESITRAKANQRSTVMARDL